MSVRGAWISALTEAQPKSTTMEADLNMSDVGAQIRGLALQVEVAGCQRTTGALLEIRKIL